jgi:hypothetical protein
VPKVNFRIIFDLPQLDHERIVKMHFRDEYFKDNMAKFIVLQRQSSQYFFRLIKHFVEEKVFVIQILLDNHLPKLNRQEFYNNEYPLLLFKRGFEIRIGVLVIAATAFGLDFRLI